MTLNAHQKRVASWKVAWKLAFRQVQRANIWMNVLVVVIMLLTFLNLIVVTGILTGLVQGMFKDYQQQQTGEVIISPLVGEERLVETHSIRETLQNHPEVRSFSERYIAPVTVEANYQTRWDFNTLANSIDGTLAGIDPDIEDSVTGLAGKIIAGEYLNAEESGYVVIGSSNLAEYSDDFDEGFDPLRNVTVGTKIKLTYTSGGESSPTSNQGIDRVAEFTVKGIVFSKVDTVAGRVYITKDDWGRLTNQSVDSVGEFAVRLPDGTDSNSLVAELTDYGFTQRAQVRTANDATPAVLIELRDTFGLLGNAVGVVAVIVSSITVFVVIYINALTRRKQIGILKGIGINGSAIKRAYIMQSLFYAGIGSTLGYIVIFFMLVPYFNANPIDFPFSDGVLAVSVLGTLIRAVLLIGLTVIAGYIPSWLIVRQNTLDSILGR